MFEETFNGRIEKVKTDKMYVEITSHCNLHCIHCYNESGYDNNNYMKLDIFEAIIQYVSQTDYKNIAISGGEPLTHPLFYRFVDICRNNHISYTIITNGLLIDERFIQYFKEDPLLDGIQISMEGGTDEIHDMVRGKGTFSMLMKKLNLLQYNQMIGKVYLKMTVTRLNYNKIDDAHQLAVSLGVHQISFGWLNIIGRGADNQEKLSLSTEMVEEAMRTGNRNAGKLEDTICADLGVAHTCVLSRYSPIMVLSPRITPDGFVYPCSMFESNTLFMLGKLSEHSMDDILNSERTKALLYIFILRKFVVSKCESCAAQPVCGRGCIARAYSSSNTIFSSDDYCHFYKSSILRSYQLLYSRKDGKHDR